MTAKRGSRFRAVLLIVVSAIPAVGQAQTGDFPRGSDGKPDLSGIWQVLNSAAWDLQDHSGSLNVPPGPERRRGRSDPVSARRGREAAGELRASRDRRPG